MPGPAPKTNNRQERPGRDIPWVELPATGRSEWPDAPDHLGEHGRDWWDRNWATPTASQWGPEDFDAAVRRAELQGMWRETKDPKLLTEMRHLDTQLGLTPKARKELRWRVVDDAGEVVEENGKRLSPAERRKRMKAV